jgi:hypothetical protein
VSWEENQERLAALREAAAPPAPQDAPREEALRPPGPAVPEAEPTRAVSWEEYEERLRGRPAPSPQDRAGKDGVKGLDAVLQEYLRGEDPPTGPSPPPPGSPRKR